MFRSSFAFSCLVFLVAPPLLAETADTTEELEYQRPVPELARLVDAPLTPWVQPSPDRETIALLERPSLPSIAALAEPEVRLGGLRINPRTNGPSRVLGASALTFVDLQGQQRGVGGLPTAPRIRSASWSPDGRHLAFLLDREERVELWVADRETALARQLIDRGVNDAAPGASFHWLVGSGGLVTRLVLDARGEPPVESAVPRGPVVQENTGEATPARTYQDLLAGPHDEALFEHYLRAEFVRVGLDGTVKQIGPAAVTTSFAPSPDGRYLLTQTRHRPYSYVVPWYRFPNRVEVWSLDSGTLVRQIADQPLQESIPISFGSVETGPRAWEWRSDAPATLAWAETQDGGDIRAEVEVRDRLYLLASPFDGDPVELVELPRRLSGMTWGDGDTAIVEEYLWQTRERVAYRIRPDAPARSPETLFAVSLQDAYGDPGSPMTRINAGGQPVLLLDDGAVFFQGVGSSEEGNRPFVRRLELGDGTIQELFRSKAPWYEDPLAFVDLENRRLLVMRETVSEPPNLFVRDLDDGSLRQLTQLPHPYPELAGVQKESLRYVRDDGIPLSATLYLPPGYDAERDGPLPTLIWAYPEEFKSADDAGQRTDSPLRFNRLSFWGAVPFALRGYAVLDDASMPIVGEGEEEPNDSFLAQLEASARAAIEEGARRGVVDAERVAIGGHSYGAFMTANLLAHTDLFRTGIARSGAYNRTLTPFGFQAEERTYWDAPEVYYTMSPFMHAEKIDEPILLIHGQADNNPGTFTLQSERLYGALKGHGAHARLVLLPHESHGYRARESVLHMLWEEDRWLDEHLRGDGEQETPPG